jgi:glycosyltransferase involved in cell wall biosynthesis
MLLIIGLFPSVINFPAELLSLRGKERGRIITLLLFSNAFLWFLYLAERAKTERRYLQFDALVRQLSIRDFFYSNSKKNTSGSIFILIPAFNEAKNLTAILPIIPDEIQGIPVNILVIDDGSSDDTSLVAEKYGALVAIHTTNRGGGAALNTGYSLVKKLNALYVVTMDADGQHNPEEIPKLAAPIINNEADLIIGSRILGSCDEYSRIRLYGVNLFSKLINIMQGSKITDCSSGFRAFNKIILEKCVLVQEQYHTAELIIETAKRGYRIEERPVNISARLSGKSKKGRDIKYGLFFLRTILKTWFR